MLTSDFLTQDQIDLIRRNLAPKATEDEFAIFIAQCNLTGLNPMTRQIYSVQRKQWNSDTRQYEMRQIIQVSIDGFRLIAQRSGEYAGQTHPLWCGPDGEWRDVWLEETPPAAAKVGVYRRGFEGPVYAVALYSAYVQGSLQGKEFVPSGRWKGDPAGMLSKCAEALALRKAFPQELSGLYTTEEMTNITGDHERGGFPGLPEAVEGEVQELTETEQPPALNAPAEAIPSPAATRKTSPTPVSRKTPSQVAREKAEQAAIRAEREKQAETQVDNPVREKFVQMIREGKPYEEIVSEMTVTEAHEVKYNRRGTWTRLDELVTDDLKKLVASLDMSEDKKPLTPEQWVVRLAARKLISYYENGGTNLATFDGNNPVEAEVTQVE